MTSNASIRKTAKAATEVPEMTPPLTTTQIRLSDDAVPSSQSRAYDYSLDLLRGRSSTTSGLLDPADQAILVANESKERRKKEETRLELEKIRERVHYTLTEYQPEAESGGGGGGRPDTPTVQDLSGVTSPEELYRLLTDVRLRAKYQQQVTVLLLGHEAALEDRERLLQSIHEFFQETQAGNTSQLLQELSSEEIDLTQATLGLETALKTAQAAGERLLEIKKDMGQLFAIVQAFPDTKKGRKKLEKALLKAQEEVELLQGQLTAVQGELDGSREKMGRLQKQVDSKTTECERLRKAASQVEQLQKTNAGLQLEATQAKEDAATAKKALERERQEKLLQLMAKKEEAKEVVREVEEPVDSGRVSELEAALSSEKENAATLEAKIESMEGQFREEREALVAEHEAEIQEMRSCYEEQMKSLVEDDVFSDMGSIGDDGESGGGGGGEEVDYEPQMMGAEGSSELASGSAVEQLKKEHHQREMKLRDELNDVKNKSRKAITSLKVQLNEAQNRASEERGGLHKQIAALERERGSISAERDQKSEKITSLEEIVTSLKAQLAEAVRGEEERDAQILQLQRELEAGLAARLAEEGGRPGKASHLMQQSVNRSAQWSEKSQSDSSPPFPPFPILPMDEVHYSCEPSANQLLSDGGGATPRSVVHLGGHQTPLSEGSPFPSGPQFFHGSLDQSISSGHHHLGTPQGYTPPPLSHAHHPPNALHMLAGSRLSHHSPQASSSLSHDHPVVVEWVKTCDMVVKFRDSLVEMLSEDMRFECEVEDLCSIEGQSVC